MNVSQCFIFKEVTFFSNYFFTANGHESEKERKRLLWESEFQKNANNERSIKEAVQQIIFLTPTELCALQNVQCCVKGKTIQRDGDK